MAVVAADVARRLPRGGLRPFPDLDHFGPMTAPDEVGAVVAAALRGGPVGPAGPAGPAGPDGSTRSTIGSRFSRRPRRKLSSTTTRFDGSRASRSTKWLPINPAPPVMRIRVTVISAPKNESVQDSVTTPFFQSA